MKFFKKLFIPILLLIVAISGSFFYFKEKPTKKKYFLMDTIVNLTISGKDKDLTSKLILEEIQKINEALDIYNLQSEISKVNASGCKEKIKVSELTFKVMEEAKRAAILTHGLFDPTIEPLMKLWGFVNKTYKVPIREEIKNTLSCVDYKKIVLSPDDLSVFLLSCRTKIDLGGIAKGYALDKIKEILENRDLKIEKSVIDLGGNLLLYSGGKKKDWKVGIKDPGKNGIYAVVNLEDSFVSTSGSYERFFSQNGTNYHHIINPYTGYQENYYKSITVISKNGAMGDALSTAMFLMDKKTLFDFYNKLKEKDNLAIIGIDINGEIFYTENLKGKVELSKNE